MTTPPIGSTTTPAREARPDPRLLAHAARSFAAMAAEGSTSTSTAPSTD